MIADARYLPLKDESVNCVVTSPRDGKGRFVKGHSYNPDTQFKKGKHWREPKLHWNKEWLLQKYAIEELPASEIARIEGCGENNILYWLNRYKIPCHSVTEVRKIKHWGLAGENNPMYGIRGSLHPNWQGGLTPFRQALYSKTEGKAWFKKVYQLWGRKCALCLSKNGLEVHHILKFSKYPLLALDPKNGIPLCKPCHNKTKGKEKKYIKKFLALYEEVRKVRDW